MKAYIDKSTVIAEIERLIEVNKVFKKTWKWKLSWFRYTLIGRIETLEGIKNYINSIKTKNVADDSDIKLDLVTIRKKVQDALSKSAIDYYEAERAFCEMVVPQQWKDDRQKAYNEFIWRCQDYQIVNESDNIDLEDLNYNYL